MNHNHIPRETAAVTLSKSEAWVERNGSCLQDCSEEAMSNQQRFRKLEKLCVWLKETHNSY